MKVTKEVGAAFSGRQGNAPSRQKNDDGLGGTSCHGWCMAEHLSHRVIGAAIEVHRVLGPGFLETIYEGALCHELALRNVPHQRQCSMDVVYKGQVLKGQRLDLVVGNEIVVEIKSVHTLPAAAVPQVISYLRASGLKYGLILNFRATRLIDGIRRVLL